MFNGVLTPLSVLHDIEIKKLHKALWSFLVLYRTLDYKLKASLTLST